MKLGSRGSKLALAQAQLVAGGLGGAEVVAVKSDGEPGDKERFVRGVDRAVLDGEVDLGVHSAKDLPGERPDGLQLVGVPAREEPADAYVGPASSLADVPEGARIGTSSLRRRSQLLAARPDLDVRALHGNVDTRLRKLADGECDGVVLAVRYDSSRFGLVERARRRLADVGVPVIGAVVNGVRAPDSAYGGYYAYGGGAANPPE